MLTYWVMFLVPAIAALANPQVEWKRLQATRGHGLNGAWFTVIIMLTLLIGLRYQVGGDWASYLFKLEETESTQLDKVFSLHDPGYALIELISTELGVGIFGVNLIGGFLFSVGLAVFCRHLPRPWLALTVAIPYTVIVVGMGYSRQAIALGLGMVGLVSLARSRPSWFVFWVLLGATFHKSAVLLLPIAALAVARGRVWTIALVSVTLAAGYSLLLAESADDLIETYYTSKELESAGAWVRLAMNAVPAVIFLVLRRRFEMTRQQRQLWLWVSIIALVMFALNFLYVASTALDRMALYLLPLQLVVFAYLPNVVGLRSGSNPEWVGLITIYYAVVQFVWLNYGHYATYWIPYQFYPLVNLF